MNLQEIRKQFERQRGKQQQVKEDWDNTLKECEKIQREITVSEKSQAIIMAVAQATQKELEYRITEPVTLAQAAVYENPYKMEARFEVTGRGNTEIHLGFERNGYVIRPLEASGSGGGGPIDIGSFALRIGAWSLSHPRSRPILILDEPFRWVSRNKMPLAGQMLKEVSTELGLQIIMISHISELIEIADKVIHVEIHNGVSKVK